MTRVFFFFHYLSRNFGDQLRSNFHRFVNLCTCWDTPSEKTGLWQLPIVSMSLKCTVDSQLRKKIQGLPLVIYQFFANFGQKWKAYPLWFYPIFFSFVLDNNARLTPCDFIKFCSFLTKIRPLWFYQHLSHFGQSTRLTPCDFIKCSLIWTKMQGLPLMSFCSFWTQIHPLWFYQISSHFGQKCKALAHPLWFYQILAHFWQEFDNKPS